MSECNAGSRSDDRDDAKAESVENCGDETAVSARRSDNSAWSWIRENSVIFTIIGTITGIVSVAILVRGCWAKGPDFTIECKSVAFIRQSEVELPGGIFRFDIRSNSEADYSIRFDSCKFDSAGKTYRLTGDSGSCRVLAKGDTSVRFWESSVFFDTVLAMPFDAQTTSMSFYFSTGGESIVVTRSSEDVKKCLFIQSPKWDVGVGDSALCMFMLPAYIGDSLDFERFLIAKSTARFIQPVISNLDIFNWCDRSTLGRRGFESKVALNSRALPPWLFDLDPQVFHQTFAGLFIQQSAGNHLPMRVPSAAEIFAEQTPYQLAKSLRQQVDSTVITSSEFVYIVFDDVERVPPFYDEKLARVQYINTEDPANPSVKKLDSLLRSLGYRVSIVNRPIVSALLSLRMVEGFALGLGQDPFIQLQEYMVPKVQSDLRDSLILIDFNKLPLALGRTTDSMLAAHGFQFSRQLVLPTNENANLFGDYLLMETSRVYCLRSNLGNVQLAR